MSKQKIYPFAVAAVRSMENKLLSKQKLMQMAEAKSAEEAMRILADSEYGKTQVKDVHDFEEMISAHLEETYTAVDGLIPSEKFIDIFLYKNDYHNLKVLIKEEISKQSGAKYLIRGGTIDIETLRRCFRERDYANMPNIKGTAINEAIEKYAKTKNGQYIDMILDQACFSSMAEAAERLGNPYVSKYVSLLADLTNLKMFLRVKEMGRAYQVFSEAYVPGGSIKEDVFSRAFQSDNPASSLKETSFGALCDQYMGAGFTVFEKACDDYLMEYVKDAKYKTLTPEPVMGYILAKETEAKSVRIIMTCKLHDIPPEIIKERVREVYV